MSHLTWYCVVDATRRCNRVMYLGIDEDMVAENLHPGTVYAAGMTAVIAQQNACACADKARERFADDYKTRSRPIRRSVLPMDDRHDRRVEDVPTYEQAMEFFR